MRWVNDGERFTAGSREFIAVMPPTFDSPTTVWHFGSSLEISLVPSIVSRAFLRSSSMPVLIGKTRQLVFLTENVGVKYREWKERGVKFDCPPELAPFGSVVVNFEDVDGNRFAMIEFDQATRLVEEQRRQSEERLESERRTAQELEIARQVQARLFPQRTPAMVTLEYAGACQQARHVGGDYYDFLELGAEPLGLVVGDIAGKGIAAALLMANLQASLRSHCAIASDQPERFLRSVNQQFCANTADGDYATFFFTEYDDKTRRMRYANCGHLAALLLRRDGSLERLVSQATVLGLFEDWNCLLEERQLFPGDVLVLYTDGVTESMKTFDLLGTPLVATSYDELIAHVHDLARG
jgi:hypothetical protein